MFRNNPRNPFDDDEEEDDDVDVDLSSSSSSSLSKENSEDSAHLSYDNDDDDDDDDSLLYHECYNEDMISYDPPQERRSSILSEDTFDTARWIQKRTVTNNNNNNSNDIETMHASHLAGKQDSKRRVAPLSFDIPTVPVLAAKPALDFDKVRITSHQKPDFVSPLETALIDQVDHLKRAAAAAAAVAVVGVGDNNKDEDCHAATSSSSSVHQRQQQQQQQQQEFVSFIPGSDNSSNSRVNHEEAHHGKHDEQEKYFKGRFKYLSSYLSSFTRKGTGTMEKNELLSSNPENRHDDGTFENQPLSSHERNPLLMIKSDGTTDLPSSPHDQSDFFNSMPGKTSDGKSIPSPLVEAKDVLKRMDRVQHTLLIEKKKKNKSAIDTNSQKVVVTKSMVDDKRVLKKIQMHSKDSAVTIDHRHSASPWNRLIILEELGTASSWIILLLPYISFVLAIALDSKASLWETTSKEMSTNHDCATVMMDHVAKNPSWFPLSPTAGPCTYRLDSIENVSLSPQSDEYEHFLENDGNRDGVIFTSGPMNDVSVFTTFLYGDVTYSSLTSASVSLIAEGLVEYSTVVSQQPLGKDPLVDTEWLPVSTSKPQPLSMVCNHDLDSTSKEYSLLWNCKSPRLVDVLFSLPDTSILTGGAIRVDTIISLATQTNVTQKKMARPSLSIIKQNNATKPLVGSIIYSNNISDRDELANADWTAPQELLLEIAHSASYKFTHSSELRTKVLIVVRIASLFLSIMFICFWFWCMGINGFFLIGNCSLCSYRRESERSEEYLKLKKHRKEVLWWECPWILFPERRYLLFLLFALLLLQNPLLAYMYFKPSIYSSTKLHIIADSLIGIGFHSILCLWLCLCEGLRYHTAKAARKRATHLKEILELRRATQYLAKDGASKYSSIDSPSHHLTSYFNEFGDLYGSGPSAWMNLRLKHDPFGDGWADFLIPKLCLFFMGICTVILTSYFRFYASVLTEEGIFGSILKRFSVDASFLKDNNFVFTISSTVQFIILALWAILIIRAAIKTGTVLKKEPFLSTRPAQLAYRILMSILVLGVTSFVIPFSLDMLSFFNEWSTMRNSASGIDVRHNATLIYETSSEYYLNQSDLTAFKIMMAILLHATHRFPYCGTALSLGPGEIIYVTCVTMIVAFIFLPSTSYILDEDNQTFESKPDGGYDENQRKDKRDVLTMSRYTHTWRAFPMPIERHKQTMQNNAKSVESYQIDKCFKNISNERGRGTIFKCNYVPIFCVETALWLAECSWQTYYSSSEYKTDEFAPGVMNLDSVGMELEADIYNEKSDTRAFIASNIANQVDGESDSIIVIAFRGTCSSTNLKTDFNWGQEALPESFINGTENRSQYQIKISNNMDAEAGHVCKVKLVKDTKLRAKGLIREADSILRSVPVTRLAFPCVHSGFIEAYNLVRDQIIQVLVQVLERQIKKAIMRCNDDDDQSLLERCFVLPKIYVTGHSLGGALAQLMALDIACNVEVKIESSSLCLHRGHVRRESDGCERVKRTVSYDLPLNSSERSTKDIDIKPQLRRRHSFTMQSRSSLNHNGITDESVDFVHEMLSGVGFASENEKSISLRPPIAVYTFGQPRVGNHAFTRFYKAHVPHTFRVVAEGDAITSLPLPTSCPPALYKHAGLEVILDEGSTGNILVGPTVVETLFRFSKVRTNMFAHLMEKYRDGLESALTHDELQEVYRTHGVDSRSFRSGYNTSDLLPDWVTHISRRNF